jgi:hypothetical protein
MARAKLITLCCGIALVFGIAGFWFGVREGMRLGVLLDSVPRGSIAVYHLRALDSGKTGNMRVNLEGQVDAALISAHQVQGYPLHALIEPIWGYPLHYHADSLQRLANYRKATPSPLRAEALAKEPAPTSEEGKVHREAVLDGARQADKTIELMVQRHSGQAKNAQP